MRVASAGVIDREASFIYVYSVVRVMFWSRGRDLAVTVGDSNE
jgi:hypothetical protein